MKTFDLLVVGGGAGGLTAAREGVRRGARTALVSESPLGGDCTHTGCVPSKTLLAEAEKGASFSDAMAAVHRSIERIAATEDATTLRREGIEVLGGHARLTGPGTADVDGARVTARRIVLATGARPAIPSIPGLVDVPMLTHETLFSQRQQPKALAVLGGGSIGVEMAQAFAALGTAVTLIEKEPRLLPREEPEASEVLARVLAKRGVHLRLGQRLERAEPTTTGARLHLDDGTTVDVDQVLVAVGRTASTDDLGLEDAGVETDERGFIRTDDSLATTADHVWAIGDVNGRVLLTHAAARMAFVATQNALSRWSRVSASRFDPAPIPWVTFTSPEVARVGMTEAESVDHGGRVAHLPLEAVDRAIITDATDGFVKIVAGPRRGLGNVGGGRILGATIVAPTGGELIHEGALAIRTGMFTGRLAQTVHAYPTWSTAVQQAAAQFFMTIDGHTARSAERPG